MLEAWLIGDTQKKSLLAICLSLLGEMCRCREVYKQCSVAKAIEFSRGYKIKNLLWLALKVLH